MERDLLFLLGEVLLDLLEVEELGAELEGEGELVAEDLAVALDLCGVALLELGEGLGVLLLGLEEVLVPLLVELLVLLDVGLLALLALLGLVEDQLLVAPVVVLLLQLRDPVLRHLRLHVLPLPLARVPVLLQHLAVEIKIPISLRQSFS